ncbi:transmembrane protein 272-like [Liolophura sinensis]|uniref:transmembrane protein 272-like n=1 Tax=Liolophura sinensis TaxID=3198878 RepID=UPI00315886AE
MADVEGGHVNRETSPPSYESTGPIGDEAPPSYESLFGKIKKTKDESEGTVDFTQNACKLCCSVICGSIVGLVILGLSTALPIAMIVIGSMYLHDCPVERYIPIYLVVGGSFGLFYFFISLCNRAKSKRDGEESDDSPAPCLSTILCLVSCFTTAWFIAGNVWVYRTYSIWSADPVSKNYCNQTLYLFAFWQLTACYIMLAIGLVLVVCCGCLLFCLSEKK